VHELVWKANRCRVFAEGPLGALSAPAQDRVVLRQETKKSMKTEWLTLQYVDQRLSYWREQMEAAQAELEFCKRLRIEKLKEQQEKIKSSRRLRP
jgi:hypothetical protein